MKKTIFAILLCVFLAGCANIQNELKQPDELPQAEGTETEVVSVVILPLPDSTMEALDNSTVNISFGTEDIYRDASGRVVLRMQVYSYEKFDMVDISGLKIGDTMVLSGEEIMVNSVERDDYGTVHVNGGLDEGGFDLATDENSIFYVHGYSDMKSWYLAGDAECYLTDGFTLKDSSDLEQGTVLYSAEDFVNGSPTSAYGFLPQNTTVRIENGQVAEMNRIYTP